MKKAIILAAGPSTRLRPHTNDIPKCVIEINGKTILKRIIDAFERNNIEKIAIVTGYKKEIIEKRYPKFTYYHNPDYLNNNILRSLFYAEKEMDEGFIVSYSDIIYGPKMVKRLLNSNGDISIIVDTDWKKRYEGRTMHPTDEAELVVVRDNKIVKISKFMNPDVAHGEFIGLAKFTKKGAEILKRNYKRCLENKWCGYEKNQRFHDATSIEKAYLTDMLQELINRDYPIENVDIKGNPPWIEIDTPQDLKRAEKIDF